MTKSSVQLHWDYFLLLEKDLAMIAETLEISEKNHNAYGPRITQLILACGSELDVALKSFVDVLAPSDQLEKVKKWNMNAYRRFISDCAREQFRTARVKFLRSNVVTAPWREISSLSENETFSWWRTYNKVKHERVAYYEDANLGVSLNLISALMIVDCYLAEASLEPLSGFTRIMDWDYHRKMPQLEQYYSESNRLRTSEPL